METAHKINDMYVERFAFIEDLSREFIGMTGCGIYVYMNPLDLDTLFDQYQSVGLSLRAFARQCARNLS